MPRRVLTLLLALALAAFGCSGTRIDIVITPEQTPMESVTVDAVRAERGGAEGLWTAEVQFKQDEASRDITIEAKSARGVTASETRTITPDGPSRFELVMPAYVDVQTPKANGPFTVSINGPREIAENGLYSLPPGSHKVEVADGTGSTALGTVTAVAGEVRAIALNPTLAASFTVSPVNAKYGDVITFDASQSTPTGNVSNYRWTFGDGTVVQGSDKRTCTHKYEATGEGSSANQSYTVVLQVSSPSTTRTAEKSQAVVVALPTDKLTFSAEYYPQETPVLAGEPVQLKLALYNASIAAALRSITFYFGDEDQGAPGRTIDIPSVTGSARPILISHSYPKAGRYSPRIEYQYALRDAKVEAAQINGSDGRALVVVVGQKHRTDDELIGGAWADASTKLGAVLESAGTAKMRLALASSESANFEYDTDHPEVADAIERLTRLLVTNGYTILEKTPHVLARLAPEAARDVNTLSPENSKFELRDYCEALEYVLTPYHLGPDKPILYSAMQAGAFGQFEVNWARQQRDPGLIPSDRGTLETHQDAAVRVTIPTRVALFKTAECLIVLRVVRKQSVSTTHAVAFDAELQEPLGERTATVTLGVRILDREGRILVATELTGVCAERVSHSELARMSKD